VRACRLLGRGNFGLLWSAGLISLTGDWILRIGLPIYVYQLTGSALATSAMFIAGTLPSVLFGSVAGVYVDRWDRRRTFIIGNLLLAAVLLPVALVQRVELLWIVYIAAFLESLINLFVGPAEGALLPALVEPEELVTANSLNALNSNIGRLVGPPLGGVIAVATGILGVAFIDATTFMIAALLVALMRGTPDTRAATGTTPDLRAWTRLWRDWVAGLSVVRMRRAIAAIFLLLGLAAIGEGVFSVLFILYVVSVLGGGAPELGVLMSSQAVGGLLGSFLLVPLSTRASAARLIGWGALLFGAIDLLIFNAPALGASLPVIAALFVLVGLPAATTFPAILSLIQSGVPDAFRGRVLGAMNTTSAVLRLAGLGIAGALAAPLGVVTVLNVQGVAYVVAGIAMLLLLPRAISSDRRAGHDAAMVAAAR